MAAMEAETARAAALLVTDDSAVAAGIEYDGHDVPPAAPKPAVEATPATWRLPAPASPVGPRPGGLTAAVAIPHATRIEARNDDFVLPDPATMPPISDDERERLQSLHSRIEELKSQLAAAMSEAEDVLSRATPRKVESEPRPELVDRRL